MTTSYNRDIATSDTAAELTDGYHLVVEALKLNDIRTIYGVVGIPITDVARIAQASGMRYIGFRHESDAGHAAAAAGFMTKKPGICLTVSAPGFLNGLVALANATTNYFPMAQISGSSERHIVDLKRGDYEELRVFCGIPRRMRYASMDDRCPASLVAGTAPPHVYAIHLACSSSGTKYPPD
jgi:oxalyl-CoA decarboxylase